MAVDIYSGQTVLKLSGGPLCVYEAGDESLPPVLLLHGAMYDEARFTWHHLAPALSRTRHVYAVDFPRHGKSRPWSGIVGQERLVEVIKEVTRHFKIAPLPLVGLSMGGGVAIGYMLKYPDDVTGGVFINPGGLGDRVKLQFFSWAYVRTPGALKALTHTYARYTPEQLKKKLAPMLQAGLNTPGYDELVDILYEEAQCKWKYREKAMDDWQSEGIAPFKLKLNFLPELHRIEKPTLWLSGKNDPLVGQSVMEEAARLSKGRLCVVENAGHILPLEQPEVVHRFVNEFLEENKL